MKNLSCLALTLSIVTFSFPGIALAQYRGTIQIQGPDITQNYRNGQGTLSESWSQAAPLTKKEGRQKLAIIENQLTKAQKDIRRDALDSAITYMNRCPDKGCPVGDRSWPGSKYRVDIQIFEGSAFTGTPPQ